MSNRAHSVDRLYFWLGVFTDVYLIAIAFEFFTNLHQTYPVPERILSALSGPYLGALAVYVVLKELRKRRTSSPISLHLGERYVWAWLALLAATTAAVAGTARYRFDASYEAVMANSLTALMVYLGARISKL